MSAGFAWVKCMINNNLRVLLWWSRTCLNRHLIVKTCGRALARGVGPIAGPPRSSITPWEVFMRRFPETLLAACIFLLGACAPDAQSPVAPEQVRTAAAPLFAASGSRGISGQYIVVLKEGANPRLLAALAKVAPEYV